MPRRSTTQLSLFPVDEPPPGFALRQEIITPPEEQELLHLIRQLPFGPFIMHGVEAKRRIARFDLREPDPLSGLEKLRKEAAALAGVSPSDFAHALVTEYQPGAGIGWHCDLPQFGIVAGVSLGATCRMRFQKGQGAARETWEAELPPRSLYVLSGIVRDEWQHSIPAVKALRYSITFRTNRP